MLSWPKPLVLFVALMLGMGLSGGQVFAQQATPPADSNSTTFYDEAEAQAIDRMLMCPVCPAITIDQAQVELAQQMRRLVREMLAQGSSREEILDFFAQRYGAEVLAAPPKSGINLLAWVIPPVGVVAALLAGLLVIRSMAAGRQGEVTTEDPWEEELEPYLQFVDQEFGLSPDPASSSALRAPEEEGPEKNG